MKLSLGTRISTSSMNTANGYGYATDRMVDSLNRLGYSITDNDPTAPVEIWFDQPHHWKWRDGQYKIGYHPWESTRLQKGWVEKMNNCDEIWTPSPLIADWYRADGVKPPVHVYEHGVDPVWTPTNRVVDDKIRFLHVGAEAARKGGWDVLRLFRSAFFNRDDVELTLKMVNQNWNGIERVGKTNIINRKMPLTEMVGLFHSHHVFVYPSWGEGFGLTPLQAMATGMPTMCTGAWAPYERFLDPNLTINSELKTSPWPEVHPGKMLRPKFDEIVDQLRWVADNYEQAHTFAQEQTDKIYVEYDWDTLTKDAFEKLASRLEN